MTPTEREARALIGKRGSRFLVPTPALIVDLDAADANIAEMASRAKTANLSLRPHAKSHKSAALSKMQVSAGAVGVCCAKLGEAEALAAAGVRNILLTSPIVSELAVARAVTVAQTDPDFALVVDHPQTVGLLAQAASSRKAILQVLIDVDVGMGRTGVADPAAALAIAKLISASPNLKLVGVQGYGGVWQHVEGFENRRAAVEAGMAKLQATIDVLRAGSFDVPLVTGGGTGTFAADVLSKTLTEVQPGSYIFMDMQYRDALKADRDGQFQQSLFVQAQVLSANQPGWVTVDAGLKAFATDGPEPRPVGKFEATKYIYFGDEHGAVPRVPGLPEINLGDRIELIPPHCDPTVDRYDFYYFVRKDVLVDIVPIEAARRSQ